MPNEGVYRAARCLLNIAQGSLLAGQIPFFGALMGSQKRHHTDRDSKGDAAPTRDHCATRAQPFCRLLKCVNARIRPAARALWLCPACTGDRPTISQASIAQPRSRRRAAMYVASSRVNGLSSTKGTPRKVKRSRPCCHFHDRRARVSKRFTLGSTERCSPFNHPLRRNCSRQTCSAQWHDVPPMRKRAFLRSRLCETKPAAESGTVAQFASARA